MPAHKLAVFILTVAIVLSIFSPVSSQIVSSPKGSLQPALLPWIDKLFSADTNAYFLSADFGGKYQIPMFNYIIAGDLYLAYKVDGAMDSCGPDGAWTCKLILPNIGSPPFYSPLTSFSSTDTFQTTWVYQNEGTSLMHYTNSWLHDFSSSSFASGLLLRLDTGTYNGYHLAGNPSLAFDSAGQFHAAVILTTNAIIGIDKLVYIYPGDTTNTSCGFLTKWTCAEIASGQFLGPPQLVINASDSPRIAYYDESNERLMYAYPQPGILFHPNCGPGGDTWRCIIMDEGTAGGYIFPAVSMDFGSGSPQIAYIYDSPGMLPQRLLMVAKYVSSGGNCGQDYRFNGSFYELVYRWQCSSVAVIDNQSPYISSPFSLKVDPENYPVIAYAYVDGASNCLGVTYPPERVGGTPGPWIGDKIDCPVYNNIGLALNNAGLGFVVFGQYSNPSNTNIAFQQFTLNLPIILR